MNALPVVGAKVKHSHSVNGPFTMPPVRTLVVDDHRIVCEGLAVLLERENNIAVVGSAMTGEEAVLAARRLRLDMIIMDLVLPGLNGIDATRRILSEFPRTHIIVLSACYTPQHVRRSLHAGARGYVLKTAVGAELLRAVKVVTAGGRYVSPAIAALFVDGVLTTAFPPSPFERLSTRETEVLRQIVAGSTSAEIARHLSLSRKTVDTYRSRMMVKLGVANRSELIRFALEYDTPLV
jgi:DNA-binding NarL/FixJ family response regulator